ncbi:hypothetical protein ACFVGM_27610 [Kitasatospora purpeofusca]|uniref:hypothetical protein n=1 Tax=Kitasatospora purpeofusca TaxID=67352 RepID=UPI0036B7463D
MTVPVQEFVFAGPEKPCAVTAAESQAPVVATASRTDVLVLIGRTTGCPRTCPEPCGSQYTRFAFTRPLGDRVVLNLAGRPVHFPAGP